MVQQPLPLFRRSQSCIADRPQRVAGSDGVDAVRAMVSRVRELGVTAVPFFIFDDRLAVSGAQEPEALVGVIEEALAAPVAPA